MGRVWCKLGGKSFGTCMTPQLAKILWHITRPCRNRIREHILGWPTTANIKSVTPGILNIVKHFTFEHNNSNQDTMSALTWHQYKCYILIQKLHVQYYLIPSCLRITMTIRYVINFFSSSPYNYLLKTFNFWNMLVMEWLFYNVQKAVFCKPDPMKQIYLI